MDDGVVTMEDTQGALWGEYNPDPACQWPIMTVFSSVLPQILRRVPDRVRNLPGNDGTFDS